MNIKHDALVTISACGEDAEEILESIGALFQNSGSNAINPALTNYF